MKQFRFSLEKVLKLKQYHEQEAKNELGRAIGILTAIENQIKQNALLLSRAAQERFVGISAASSAAAENGDDANSDGANGDVATGNGTLAMLAWDSYILRLEQEADRLTEEAARAEMIVEEKRNLYLEASRELKVMENLKEKRRLEYRKEMFSAETRELDDVRRSSSSV